MALLGEASEEYVVANGINRNLRLGRGGGTQEAQCGAEQAEVAVGEDDRVECVGVNWKGAEADCGGGEARGGKGRDEAAEEASRRGGRERGDDLGGGGEAAGSEEGEREGAQEGCVEGGG